VPDLYEDVKAGRIQAVKVEAANDAARTLTKEPIVNPAFRDLIANRAQTPQLFDFFKGTQDLLIGRDVLLKH
jgi:glutathionylspermidine synthase